MRARHTQGSRRRGSSHIRVSTAISRVAAPGGLRGAPHLRPAHQGEPKPRRAVGAHLPTVGLRVRVRVVGGESRVRGWAPGDGGAERVGEDGWVRVQGEGSWPRRG
eukprot:6962351-Prymnesium_polylepis.1